MGPKATIAPVLASGAALYAKESDDWATVLELVMPENPRFSRRFRPGHKRYFFRVVLFSRCPRPKPFPSRFFMNSLCLAYTALSRGRSTKTAHAGPSDDCVCLRFLRGCAALCSRLREVEVKALCLTTTIIVLMLTAATLIYLVITLLYPEKF